MTSLDSIPRLIRAREDAPPAEPPLLGAPVWRDGEGRVIAWGEQGRGGDWLHLKSIGSFHFDVAASDVRVFRHAPIPAPILEDAYRRSVLPLVLQARGAEVLHASAVLFPRGVVALCGRSEAGKSTLAFALSRTGYPLWADDAVVFETHSAGARVRGLPFRLRLRPTALEHFGATDRADSTILPRTVPRLAAVFVLERGAARPVDALRLLPGDAAIALLPHAYCFSLKDRERARRMMIAYLQLVATVPVFALPLGGGLDGLPAVVATVERAIGGL